MVARALENLDLDDLSVRRLGVDAPRLSELHLGFHFMMYSERDQSSLIFRAPALETLNSSLQLGYCQQLNLQGYTIQLLQECSPNVRHDLHIPGPEGQSEKEVEDEITAMPQFPGFRNLTHLREVEFSSFSGQGYCFDIVQLLLIGAPALERMILTMQASEEGCKRPTIDLASLKSRLPHGMGTWTTRPAAKNVAELEWTPDSSMLATGPGDA
ncbi:hypothetical protein D1007_16392 [Hordeum vulgare]|nr:hypothetical protein D1007_16392 [Hordeum vulgare]